MFNANRNTSGPLALALALLLVLGACSLTGDEADDTTATTTVPAAAPAVCAATQRLVQQAQLAAEFELASEADVPEARVQLRELVGAFKSWLDLVPPRFAADTAEVRELADAMEQQVDTADDATFLVEVPQLFDSLEESGRSGPLRRVTAAVGGSCG